MNTTVATGETPIVLFDGICNLCNTTVDFIVARDASSHFRFASLQSAYGQKLLGELALDGRDFKTMVLVEGSRCLTKSTAMLRIMLGLKMPWPLLYALIAIPRPIRDLVYDFVARNRYFWFGKLVACRVPTPELHKRFLG